MSAISVHVCVCVCVTRCEKVFVYEATERQKVSSMHSTYIGSFVVPNLFLGIPHTRYICLSIAFHLSFGMLIDHNVREGECVCVFVCVGKLE